MSVAKLLFSVSLLVISSIGLGWLFLPKIKITNNLFRMVLCFFIGEIAYSLVWFLLSIFFVSPFNLIIILPILFAGIVLFFQNHVHFMFNNIVGESRVEKLFFIILVSILSFYFINSLIVPFEWDVVSYHLPVIKEMSLGKINFPLLQNSSYVHFFSPFSHFFGSLPYSSESYASILYSLSENTASVNVMYIINFIFFLYIINTFLNLEYYSNKVANLAILILISTNHGISLILTTGLVDVNLLIYQFLSYFSALMIKTDSKYIYLFVIFASYSVGQKYTSLFILLPALVYVLVKLVKNRKLQILIGNKFSFVYKCTAIFIVSGGFWYLKNLILYSNPVYPLYLGHRGMSDSTYSLLMDNLIYELRSGHKIVDLINLINVNYINEIGMIISISFFVGSLAFRYIKITKNDIFLIISIFLIYLANFYFGSQISRFVLIISIFVYLLFARVAVKNTNIAIIAVLISLFGIRLNPIQWSTWNSRISNTVLFLTFRYDDLKSKNIGCVYETYKYLENQKSRALNFWDPYASSFYDSEKTFVVIQNDNDLSKVDFSDIEYLYLNSQYKNSFVNTKKVHRDIDIDGRIEIEGSLISEKKPEFQKDNCMLFKID